MERSTASNPMLDAALNYAARGDDFARSDGAL